MIACDCKVCRSSDPRDKRTRASIHVVMDGFHVQIDAAQEHRIQCLANGINRADIVILTHGHADHILGMDDMRRFCDGRGGISLPVYSTPAALARVRQIYPYAILDRPLVSGYPAFDLREMPEALDVDGGRIFSTLLPHGSVQVLGLIFEERSSGKRFAYYTDCKEVGPHQRKLARTAEAVALDALRPTPHPSHMSIDEAIATALDIGAPRTYFTHMTHAISHAEYEKKLPSSIELAYDGRRLLLG